MEKTTNEMQNSDIDKLKPMDSSMDFHRWAQVINSLENAIEESMRSIAINRQFLKTAIEMQSRCEPPKENKEE